MGPSRAPAGPRCCLTGAAAACPGAFPWEPSLAAAAAWGGRRREGCWAQAGLVAPGKGQGAGGGWPQRGDRGPAVQRGRGHPTRRPRQAASGRPTAGSAQPGRPDASSRLSGPALSTRPPTFVWFLTLRFLCPLPCLPQSSNLLQSPSHCLLLLLLLPSCSPRQLSWFRTPAPLPWGDRHLCRPPPPSVSGGPSLRGVCGCVLAALRHPLSNRSSERGLPWKQEPPPPCPGPPLCTTKGVLPRSPFPPPALLPNTHAALPEKLQK